MLESEAVLTSTHDLRFRAKITNKMNVHVNPNCTVSKWGVRGSMIDGLVSMMPGTGGCAKCVLYKRNLVCNICFPC